MSAPDARDVPAIEVRPARPEEYDAVGELTVLAYLAGGFINDDSAYAAELADARGRAGTDELLVAVDRTGRPVGTVTLILDPASPLAELAGEGDAEMRMLAVAPDAQGAGVATALVEHCLERARQAGRQRFVLCSRPQMRAAHRIYERLGFRRAPALDWEPAPGIPLVGYALDLADRPAPLS